MTILIVDDNELNLYQLQVLLGASGYQVVAAANGAEALAKARQAPPDAIITDILMPVMDGFSLCREWKKDKELKAIPLVFYTATYTDERDREFALSLGAQRFIVKPEEPEAFLQMLHDAIQESRSLSPALLRRETEAPQQEEAVFLAQYNETLVRKLEVKVQQLEQANRELEQESTERKRAEAETRRLNDELELRVQARTADLEAANRELEAFSYSVSHDLHAPLRAIDGYAQILIQDQMARLDSGGQRLLETIRAKANRMGQLIDDLLAFAQMRHRSMQSEEIDMVTLAQAVFDDCRAHVPGRHLHFKLQPLPPAQGDPAMVRQALINLISNAIKYTRPRDQAEIEIGGRAAGEENIYFVKDNGVGFDMKSADKLFSVFQRFHSENEFEGTGVGLAVVHRVIRRHGGRVWAESAPNQGATFYFTLPHSSCVAP